jgi:formimidoylglutamate deiminase
MHNQKIFCQSLLQGDLWREQVTMTVDPEGMILSIEQGEQEEADELINGIVVAGMPNAHSHSFQRLIAGLTGPSGNAQDSFWSWREAMYHCADRISPAQFAHTASWVFIEMLKAGYTSCAEFHYLHHQPDGAVYANPAEMSERLVEAAARSGIALALLPVFYNSAGFGETGHRPMQKRFVHSPENYLKLLERCQAMMSGQSLLSLGIAPHSLRAVPEVMLHEILNGWQDKHCPVHIHIAEQPAEIESCLKFLGSRPVEWLLDNFPVNEHWCLVHATHMSDGERKQAADRGVIAGLCPTTEADLGDGVFKTANWVEAGGRFAIGSDSNVRISAIEELRLLEYNERNISGERNVLSKPDSTCGRFLYQHAAQSGGLVTGQMVGKLEPGYRADLLELDANHELMAGRSPDVALDSFIFAGDQAMINSVWVAGQRLVHQGHHAKEAECRANFAKVLADMRSV